METAISRIVPTQPIVAIRFRQVTIFSPLGSVWEALPKLLPKLFYDFFLDGIPGFVSNFNTV